VIGTKNSQTATVVAPTPLAMEKEKQANTYEVASQWKLMWWKFKKHKLAMIALPIIILMYTLAMFCEFFSPALPLERFSDYKNSSPSKIHVIDAEGKLNFPFVYGTKSVMDEYTFKKTFKEDTSTKVPLGFFVKGTDYKMWGLFNLNTRFFGPQKVGAPFFLMGTDELGRDLFTRILYGARISLSFCLVSIFFTFLIGLALGGLSGYLGGIVDTLVQRTVDLLMCIPTIPLWMALAASLPRDLPPLQLYLMMSIIMLLIGWTGLARVVRGKILSLREEDFIMSARLSGASHARVVGKHLVPSFASYIIVSITGSIPITILGETALSFLGLGLQPPVVSWGVLLQDAQNIESLAHHPWLLWPAAFIVVTVLMFNFAGDGLRDAADPYK
jgi:peptide/nickel transport system permease protein